MATVLLGIRRLYDSVDCKLHKEPELAISQPHGQGGRLLVYMGPRPRFGIWIDSHNKYITHFGDSEPIVAKHFPDAAESGYPRTFFTEIAVFAPATISDEQIEALDRDDRAARDRLLVRSDALRPTLSAKIDLIAGAIGVRIHRQFVMEPVSEEAVVVSEKWFVNHSTEWREVLEPVVMSPTGEQVLRDLVTSMDTVADEHIVDAGLLLSWLGRAWNERDVLNKFMALFIPLEKVLQGASADRDPIFEERAQAIRDILTAAPQSAELSATFNSLVALRRPSLVDRFVSMARHYSLSTCDSDIEAFRKFNRVRNAILHRAHSTPEMMVMVGNGEIQTFEDLVERYVSCVVFGDANVYQSRYRQPGRADSRGPTAIP